ARVLLVGLSFNAGTDDLRGSPLVELAASLLDAGYRLKIFDFDLHSKDFAERDCNAVSQLIPNWRDLLVRDLDDRILSHDEMNFDLIVIGKSLKHHPQLADRLKSSEVALIDLNAFVWPNSDYCRSSASSCSSINLANPSTSTAVAGGVSTTSA